MDTTTTHVSGNIFDAREKSVLEGAVVTLISKQNNYSKASNELGDFNFKHIIPGKYQITSRFLGYYTLKDSIGLESGDIVNIKIGHITDW